MAEFEFGTDSMFVNWFLKGEAKGRADIAGEHFRLEATKTAIEKTMLDREVQKHLAVNQVRVLDMATELGVDVPTLCTIMLEESRAANADFSTYCTKVWEWWFKEHEDHRTLYVEAERSERKVIETGQLDELTDAKDLRKRQNELDLATATTLNTIDATREYNRTPYEQEDELTERAAKLRQEIEDTRVMPGKSAEWRKGQADLLMKRLEKIEKKIEEL